MRPVRVFIWHRWWVIGWTVVCIVAWMAFVFLPWWWWLLILAVGFLAELYAVTHQPSATPPLTSILRRYIRSYIAFPLLGFLVATPVAYLLAGPFIGLVVGTGVALGFWLIEHFTATYFRLDRKSRR